MDAPISPGQTWRMTVVGKPAPQGSKQAHPVMRRGEDGVARPVLKNGRPVVNMKDDSEKRLKPWRQEVAACAVAAGWPGLGVAALDEAVFVQLTFYFSRPAGHFGTGRNAGVLKDSAPLYPETSGDDVDKLARGVLDALTGIVWKDDKRVVSLPARRRYGTPERMEIAVRRPLARTVGELRRLRDANPELAGSLADGLQLDLFSQARAAAQEPDQTRREGSRAEAELPSRTC